MCDILLFLFFQEVYSEHIGKNVEVLELWLGRSTSHRDFETEAGSQGCVTSDRNWPERGQVPRMQIRNRAKHKTVGVLTAQTSAIATAERTTNRHTRRKKGLAPSSPLWCGGSFFFIFLKRTKMSESCTNDTLAA